MAAGYATHGKLVSNLLKSRDKYPKPLDIFANVFDVT